MLSADSSSCNFTGKHYIMVISHQVVFPGKADVDDIALLGERAHVYYLYNKIGGGMGDDLGDLLKPANPERLSFTAPRDFRRSLARIVADLRAGK